MKYAFLALTLACGCAEYDSTPVGDEPVAGSVAVDTQALTATARLDDVLRHFGLGTPTMYAVPGTVTHWKVTMTKTLYYKVGDTSFVSIKHGYWPGLEQPLDELAKDLSGRRLYEKVGVAYVNVLNLEDKVVVRR